MSGEERRDHRRLARETVVTLKEISFPIEEGEPISVEMVDVSESGVGLKAPARLAQNTSVQLFISLPGWTRHTSLRDRFRDQEEKPLAAVGVVARCLPLDEGGFDVGIRFTDIWDEHWRAMRTRLEELLEE